MIRPALRRLAQGAMLAVMLLTAPTVAAARSITIAWDPNPEPTVNGYVVYVGPEPGIYTERHDVGKVTTFVYAGAADDRRYYFSVAAYAADLVAGPRSDEVSTLPTSSLAGTPLTVPDPGRDSAPSTQASTEPARVCADDSTGECYVVRPVLRSVGPITGLAAAPDDRLFFIDGGRQIRVVAGGRLSAFPALTIAGAFTRLSGLAIDPNFATTHMVLVGEVGDVSDGSQELSIVRYRELQGVLGERAVIIPALALPRGAEGIFTTDSAGRIYVALASAGGLGRSTRYAYNGFILRFNPDGTVPADSSSNSPILARGFDRPSGLAWNGDTQLLVTGEDETSAWLRRVDLAAPAATWPRTLGGVALTSGAGAGSMAVAGERRSAVNRVFLVDRASRLTRLRVRTDGTADAAVIVLPDSMRALEAVPEASSGAYVVASSVTDGRTSILEITPASLP